MDILKTKHEGTAPIKVYKIQKLIKNFENLSIYDDEIFDNFYNKLNDIMNTFFLIWKRKGLTLNLLKKFLNLFLKDSNLKSLQLRKVIL